MKKIHLFIIGIVGVITLTSAQTNYFNIAKYLELFIDVYKSLNTYYVDEIDPEKIVTIGIDAMLKELDPYSDFIPAEEIEQYNTQSTGEYGGIGSTIQKGEEYVKIISPYEGSPSDKAGLRSGDEFIKIAGKSAKGFSTQDVVKQLRGTPGTTIKVTMRRGETEFERVLTREIIHIDNVPYYGRLDGDIGYVKLSSFTTGAGEEVANAIKEMKKEGELKGLILDLKGNGGGLLSEAIAVTSVFVPRRQKVVTIKTREDKGNRTYSTFTEPVDVSTPLVVLVDRGSASASEIVSGSIQDLDRGVIVGRNTFGKGLVQSTRDLPYDTKLKLTTAKYLTPSGRCVQRLNYSEKDENGKPKEVPDSLRTAFKTKNGRTVFDGSGVMPDVKVEAEPFSEIAFSLFAKNYIYDYSLDYKAKHKSIAPADKFELTQTEYDNFKTYLKGKEYSYETESEKEFDEFKEALEDEKIANKFKTQLKELDELLDQQKSNDLDTYKDEIAFLLEREIAAKYYYSKGKIENGLDNDDEVKKAIELLNNKPEYSKILVP